MEKKFKKIKKIAAAIVLWQVLSIVFALFFSLIWRDALKELYVGINLIVIGTFGLFLLVSWLMDIITD